MGERTALDYDGMRRLVDVGRALLSELDPEAVLERVLETATEVTGARYAAVGVLDERRTELERFVTRGLDADTRRAIGGLPRGLGVLGVLIEDPRPLRLGDVGDHPRSYGFPTGHPPMTTFLGVPIVIRGEAWGSKRGRALVDARSVIILLRDGGELVVAAHAGHAANATGVRLPIEESTTGQVMQRRRAERIVDVPSRVGLVPRELGVEGAQSAVLVPLVFRDESLGVLAVFDRGESGDAFTEDDEQVLRAFAAGAATAVATARSLGSQWPAESPAASDQAANRPRRSA